MLQHRERRLRMDEKHAEHTGGQTAPAAQTAKHDDRHQTNGGHYGRLAAMAGLSFVAMFVLMYAMVDRFSNVFINVNQAYMAGLMTAPMIVIELAFMGAMYRNKKLNAAVVAASVALLAGCWFGIRRQTAVVDSQFLRSMIPHHAGAVLMCDEASISDPRIKALCEEIRESQTREIDQMKAIMRDRR